jgi:hypothetical protein
MRALENKPETSNEFEDEIINCEGHCIHLELLEIQRAKESH